MTETRLMVKTKCICQAADCFQLAIVAHNFTIAPLGEGPSLAGAALLLSFLAHILPHLPVTAQLSYALRLESQLTCYYLGV